MKTKIYLIIAIQSLLFFSCTDQAITDEKVNLQASLPQHINFTREGFKVVSLLINKKVCTISTLYGNDVAIRSVLIGIKKYPGDFKMALVTWQEQPNPYWFGNNIPGRLQSIEMIKSDPLTGSLSYEQLGSNGEKIDTDERNSSDRINYILHIKPSVMP